MEHGSAGTHDLGTTATLDVDDTDGLGPENIFVGPGGAAAGTYKAYVGYFSVRL